MLMRWNMTHQWVTVWDRKSHTFYVIDCGWENEQYINIKEGVNFINFALEFECVYFDRSCQNKGF